MPDSGPVSKSSSLPLHTKIFLGLIVGFIAGLAANYSLGAKHPAVIGLIDHLTDPVGQLFLRLLLLTIIPLVFSSLVVGVASLGDLRKLGRVGAKTFGYCFIISAISVLIGIGLSNLIQPGKRLEAATAQNIQERFSADASKRIEQAKAPTAKESPLMQVVKTLVPINPVTAIASETPNMLHWMFFSILFAVALTLVPAETSQPIFRVLEGLYALCARIIDLIMKVAPYAVACLIFTNTARFGFELIGALGLFMLTVLAGLALHLFGVYSLFLYLFSRICPFEFFRRIKTVMLTAFSTSSSAATLPTTLRVAEENLGVPRSISGFVLTVGATANQNGTALYEGATVLFLAQLAGVDLTLGQQCMVGFLAILGGIGTAGVPSASIPFIVVVLSSIQVNPALIGVILGVDRILDMCRTTVNVAGDLAAATYVARSEGHTLASPFLGSKKS